MDTDLEDVIYSALSARRKSGYKELYRDVQDKCSEATFNKYLKRLVYRKVVKRTAPTKTGGRGEYSIDPQMKTLGINLTKIIDDRITRLESLFDMIQSDIYRLDSITRKQVDDPKKIMPLFNRLVFSIVFVYKIISTLDFFPTSNLVPQMTKKRMKRQNRMQINKLSRLLDEMKEVNPLFHHDLCIYIAEKML